MTVSNIPPIRQILNNSLFTACQNNYTIFLESFQSANIYKYKLLVFVKEEIDIKIAICEIRKDL